MNNKFILFYSPMPRSQVRVLMYRYSWPITREPKKIELELSVAFFCDLLAKPSGNEGECSA